VKSIVLWITLILSDTTAQLLLKPGAVKAASAGWLPNSFILLGYSCYILSFAVWMQLLKDTRLFIALSGSTIAYVTIALGSHFILGEELSGQVILGTALIFSGVFLIGWGREASSIG
jgi:drug/metabolite transporter (DMT)-like permease